MMPRSAKGQIHRASVWVAGTSSKQLGDEESGDSPRARTKNTAICPRVTIASGQKSDGELEQPPVMPESARPRQTERTRDPADIDKARNQGWRRPIELNGAAGTLEAVDGNQVGHAGTGGKGDAAVEIGTSIVVVRRNRIEVDEVVHPDTPRGRCRSHCRACQC